MDAKYNSDLLGTLAALKEGSSLFETILPLGRIVETEEFAMRKWRRNGEVWYTVHLDGTQV